MRKKALTQTANVVTLMYERQKKTFGALRLDIYNIIDGIHNPLLKRNASSQGYRKQ